MESLADLDREIQGAIFRNWSVLGETPFLGGDSLIASQFGNLREDLALMRSLLCRTVSPDTKKSHQALFDHPCLAGIFRESFYKAQFDIAFIDEKLTMDHYLRKGWKLGADPHPLFSTRFYLSRNPDVRKSGLCPLLHYVHFGAKEEREPHPFFVTRYYKISLPESEVADCENALEHYLTAGWMSNVSPVPDVDLEDYVARNLDLAGVDPLTHYFEWGWLENRILTDTNK